MLEKVLGYYAPIIRDKDGFTISSEQFEENYKKYLYRSAIPAVMFAFLAAFFENKNAETISVIFQTIGGTFSILVGAFIGAYFGLKVEID